MIAETALVIEVPESENAVGELRVHYDPVCNLGMPAHITILYPFVPAPLLNADDFDVINQALSDIHRFRYVLHKVKQFPKTIYIEPEPIDRFIDMTEALVRRFPDYPPYGGAHTSIKPHLSVSTQDNKDAKLIEGALSRYFETHGPISACCYELALFGNTDGRWQKLETFALS